MFPPIIIRGSKTKPKTNSESEIKFTISGSQLLTVLKRTNKDRP